MADASFGAFFFFKFYDVENVLLVSELHCLFVSYLLERDMSIVAVFY
jgi:hypothetical protein